MLHHQKSLENKRDFCFFLMIDEKKYAFHQLIVVKIYLVRT